MDTHTTRNLFLSLVALAAIALPCAPATAQVSGRKATMHRSGYFTPTSGSQVLFHPEDAGDHEPGIFYHGRTMTGEEFAAMKELRNPHISSKPGIERGGGINPMTAGYLYETPGLNAYQTGGYTPPDDSVAVGPTSAIQPANVAVGIFTRTASGLTLDSVTDGNTFMNFSASLAGLSDPRAVYDYKNKRFFICYISLPFKDTKNVLHDYLLLATSKTNDATGPWVTYQVDYQPLASGLASGHVALFDYPSLGMDANNVYVTANVFDINASTGDGAFAYGSMIAFDKASLTAGTANVPMQVYNGLAYDTTPPYVWSQGKTKQSYLVFTQPGSAGPTTHTGLVGMYAVSGKVIDSTIKLSNPYNVVVPYYDVPGNALQPASAATGDYLVPLDSLDSRFQDKTTQRGEKIYATHAVDLLGFSMVTAYELDGSFGTMNQTINLVSSPTSFDFNPSIAVNNSGVTVVNWNATDVSKEIAADNVYQSVRTLTLPGKWPAKPLAGTLVPGGTSTVAYDYGYPYVSYMRNGDYSMTVVDPLNDNVFWGINETVYDEYDWNTYLFELSVK